jgi:hypothetical protein
LLVSAEGMIMGNRRTARRNLSTEEKTEEKGTHGAEEREPSHWLQDRKYAQGILDVSLPKSFPVCEIWRRNTGDGYGLSSDSKVEVNKALVLG